MGSYIPWFGKKREALADCEREFLESLQTATSPEKLASVAERVRAAQIRALKAKGAQLVPLERNAVGREHILQEIQFWKRLSADEIIQGYRDGKLCGHRSSEARRRAHNGG